MTNIDTQIIYDKNGNPIPQYLDVSDKTGGSAGTMKPITGQNGAQFTQLTGSIVERDKIATDLIVTAGSTADITTNSMDVSNYKKVGLMIRRKDSQSELNQPITLYMRTLDHNISYMDQYNIPFTLLNDQTTLRNLRGYTELMDVISVDASFKLENQGSSDHIYDVWLIYTWR